MSYKLANATVRFFFPSRDPVVKHLSAYHCYYGLFNPFFLGNYMIIFSLFILNLSAFIIGTESANDIGFEFS